MQPFWFFFSDQKSSNSNPCIDKKKTAKKKFRNTCQNDDLFCDESKADQILFELALSNEEKKKSARVCT